MASTPNLSNAPKRQSATSGAGFSQSQRVWKKFKQNRLGLVGGAVILVFYIVMVAFPEFVAPYRFIRIFEEYVHVAPMIPRFVDQDGQFHLRPFVYGLTQELDMETFTWIYTQDPLERHPIYFFVRGDPYRMWGLFHTDLHLFGTAGHAPIFVLGTDGLGRDLLARILYGGRISLTVGIVGVALTIILGTVLGTVSGYFGGFVDNAIQRIAELLMSFPAIPLWAALAAALPPDWSPILVFFGISVILSLVNWTNLARQVRGKVLALRDSEFTVAAQAVGASNLRIILRHLIPNVLSHVIVIGTLTIPGMIIAETALSFLGLGIQPPMTSWGVLLQEAQHVSVVLNRPWLLTPGLFVILAVLAFNFLGDAIRDAVDPYSRK